MKELQEPGFAVLLRVLGGLGLLGSVLLILGSIDARGVESNLMIGTAASSIFGSLILFAIASALSRLTEIAFYQRAAHLRAQGTGDPDAQP